MNKGIQQAELQILSVENDSDPSKEIARVKVVSAGSAGGYAIVDNTFDEEEEPSNEFRNIFIFPAIEVGVKDFIRVYTGEGSYSKNPNNAGGFIHQLYWNSDRCVWNDKEGDEATLIKFSVVNRVTVPAKKNPPAPRKIKIKPTE